LYMIMGKEKAEKFISDLGATKPILAESFAPSAERVSTGETPIAISLVRYVVTFAETGAPVDYVRMNKMLSTGQYVGLNHKAPRPNAGKAFIDFFLGAESMKLLAKAGEFVTLKGIPQLLPDADKIQAVEMDDLDSKGYAAKREEYRKLFLK
jgi:ABC-type Fe3+ transport system substrate-binding protein